MNVTGAIAAAKRRLKRLNTTTLDTDIEAELEEAMNVEQNRPPFAWFLRAGWSYMNTTAGDPDDPAATAKFVLPPDFLSESEQERVAIYDSTTGALLGFAEKGFWKNAQARYGLTLGLPVAYSISGTSIHFRPIPDKVYRIEMNFFEKEQWPSSPGNTNLWLTHAANLIVNRACETISRDILGRMPEAQMFGQVAASLRRDLDDWGVERDEAERVSYSGED